jgi:uncharacterized C2H2 Zn-finger protein
MTKDASAYIKCVCGSVFLTQRTFCEHVAFNKDLLNQGRDEHREKKKDEAAYIRSLYTQGSLHYKPTLILDHDGQGGWKVFLERLSGAEDDCETFTSLRLALARFIERLRADA